MCSAAPGTFGRFDQANHRLFPRPRRTREILKNRSLSGAENSKLSAGFCLLVCVRVLPRRQREIHGVPEPRSIPPIGRPEFGPISQYLPVGEARTHNPVPISLDELSIA